MSHSNDRAHVALALGGGGARGLAHIGVLEVLEREGIRFGSIAGTSMGGLIGALSAKGLRAREIADVARSFQFPRWLLPGGLLQFEFLFESAGSLLAGTFEDLATPLAVTAVDLEAGSLVVLHSGSILPAVRATCAVPGVMPPVEIGGRWLIDGGFVNILPVDVAWMATPDVVIAVSVGAPRSGRIPELSWRSTALLAQWGGGLPNPITAKVSFEVLVRTAEIILDRQFELATAMTGPELLIEPDLGDITLRDLHRLDDAIEAGRRATEAALPRFHKLLEAPAHAQTIGERTLELCFDPVCSMVISPTRARASATHEGATYHFCSANCHACFEREPDRYTGKAGLWFTGTGRVQQD